MATNVQRRVLVYGGKGALGSVCVELFRKQNWWVTSIDLHENDQADSNILIDGNSTSLVDQESNVVQNLTNLLGMIGYGMAKSAVHHLVSSLAQEKSGLPANSSVLAILPITLDTPMNRKFMPNANFNEWTPLTFVADLFIKWTTSPQERPKSGSL
ncbi:hypothetical protein BLA29_005551, partial [Euroglyphus maynei]